MTARQKWQPRFGKNEFRASKPFRGKQLTVRMVSPDCSKGIPVSGFESLLHSDRATVRQPTPVTGNYLPAKFEVDNFGCAVRFTLGIVKGLHGKSSVEITELSCERGISAKLPLALFRQLALRACTFSAYLMPPNFEYKLGDNFTVKAGKNGSLEIMGSGQIPVEVLNDLHNPEQDKTDKLKRVWQLYKQAPEGQRYAKVAEGFGYPPGSRSGLEWAHKWVKAARKRFAPDTVRKTKQKRGRK